MKEQQQHSSKNRTCREVRHGSIVFGHGNSRAHHFSRKGMLLQGLKFKKLNNFSNFKSVVSELVELVFRRLNVIHMFKNSELSIETGVNSKNL